MEPLHVGLRETAPPRFLEQRSSDEDHENKGTEIRHHGQRSERLERFEGTGPDDYRGEHHNQREPYNSEQVPPKPDTPQHDPTQPAAHASPAFGDRGHDEPGQDRTQQAYHTQQANYRGTDIQDSVI